MVIFHDPLSSFLFQYYYYMHNKFHLNLIIVSSHRLRADWATIKNRDGWVITVLSLVLIFLLHPHGCMNKKQVCAELHPLKELIADDHGYRFS